MDYKLSDIDRVLDLLLEKLEGRNKVFLYGEIGSGKTTLVSHLCRRLNVIEDINSPTFSLINEYTYRDKNSKIAKAYHIDLYRLKDLEEALSIGIEDYLDNEDLTFIEWPQIIEDIAPDNVLKISLSLNEDSSRKILFL